MFYQPKDGHGLPHDPFNALISPRPIGWVSTMDREGKVNLAPYSFFNAVAYVPPQIMYASTAAPDDKMVDGVAKKDSLRNIEDTGEFVVNLVTWELKDAMNKSSAPLARGVDEFEAAGLTKKPGCMVKVPGVEESPVQLECVATKIVELPSGNTTAPNMAVFGEVVGIHIADTVLTDGMIDYEKLTLISRLGYRSYGRIGEVFEMTRPS